MTANNTADPLLVVAEYTKLELDPNEKITALNTYLSHVLVGTNKGNLYVISRDGRAIVHALERNVDVSEIQVLEEPEVFGVLHGTTLNSLSRQGIMCRTPYTGVKAFSLSGISSAEEPVLLIATEYGNCHKLQVFTGIIIEHKLSCWRYYREILIHKEVKCLRLTGDLICFASSDAFYLLDFVTEVCLRSFEIHNAAWENVSRLGREHFLLSTNEMSVIIDFHGTTMTAPFNSKEGALNSYLHQGRVIYLYDGLATIIEGNPPNIINVNVYVPNLALISGWNNKLLLAGGTTLYELRVARYEDAFYYALLSGDAGCLQKLKPPSDEDVRDRIEERCYKNAACYTAAQGNIDGAVRIFNQLKCDAAGALLLFDIFLCDKETWNVGGKGVKKFLIKYIEGKLEEKENRNVVTKGMEQLLCYLIINCRSTIRWGKEAHVERAKQLELKGYMHFAASHYLIADLPRPAIAIWDGLESGRVHDEFYNMAEIRDLLDKSSEVTTRIEVIKWLIIHKPDLGIAALEADQLASEKDKLEASSVDSKVQLSYIMRNITNTSVIQHGGPVCAAKIVAGDESYRPVFRLLLVYGQFNRISLAPDFRKSLDKKNFMVELVMNSCVMPDEWGLRYVLGLILKEKDYDTAFAYMAAHHHRLKRAPLVMLSVYNEQNPSKFGRVFSDICFEERLVEYIGHNIKNAGRYSFAELVALIFPAFKVKDAGPLFTSVRTFRIDRYVQVRMSDAAQTSSMHIFEKELSWVQPATYNENSLCKECYRVLGLDASVSELPTGVVVHLLCAPYALYPDVPQSWPSTNI